PEFNPGKDHGNGRSVGSYLWLCHETPYRQAGGGAFQNPAQALEVVQNAGTAPELFQQAKL
ncbi:MAG: hypothetical protein ACREIC_32540, partial [Limisphaerales bacterium]